MVTDDDNIISNAPTFWHNMALDTYLHGISCKYDLVSLVDVSRQ